MTSKEFKLILERAISGDKDAVQSIIRQYEPLINNNSILNGSYDQDLKQYILLCIIRNISKFKINN